MHKRLAAGFVFLFSLNTLAMPTGRVIGTYNRGKLKGALSIFQSLKSNPKKFMSLSPEEFQYGTPHMHEALDKIADWSLQLKDMPLRVGDIAKKRGGKLARHVSHQIGLDVDIGYLLNKIEPTGHRENAFHNRFTEKLEVNGEISENFDLEANAKLFEKIFKELPAKQIVVGCEIYKSLEKTMLPKHSDLFSRIYAQKGHEDHFHLRLNCPEGQERCSEKWWASSSKKQRAKKDRPFTGGKWNGCGWYSS